MMQKCLIAASVLVFIVSPALAAEYYVAHKPPKKDRVQGRRQKA
jgi:hypothetical protein